MPRDPRLDALGILHHIMARGVDRQRLFHTDQDRDDFAQRLAALAPAEAWTVSAWVLISNHFHLLVRTDRRPLARSWGSREAVGISRGTPDVSGPQRRSCLH